MAKHYTSRQPKIIAFTLQKGGMGKTSCVINLAATLSTQKRSKHSRYKNRILIIDMDVHATASRYLNAYDESTPGIYDALTERCGLDDVICERKYDFGRYGTCQLDIAPTDIYAARIESKWLHYDNPEYLLKKALEKSEKIHEYDYVFIDCPPESNCLLTNIYNACDYFILPIMADSQSFANIGITYKQLSTLSTDLRAKSVIGTIINNYEITNLSSSYREYFMNNEKIKCFHTVIPHCKRYDQTLYYKTPVVFYHRNIHEIPPIFSAFRALADEFTERVRTLDT